MKKLLVLMLLFPLISQAALDEPMPSNVDMDLVDFYTNLLSEQTSLNEQLGSDTIHFGPEFTFWVPLLDSNGNSIPMNPKGERPYVATEKLTAHMLSHLVENQTDDYKFLSKKGFDPFLEHSFTDFASPFHWSFRVKPDNGVIEVTMRPMDVSGFEKNSASIEDAIFTSAANSGYSPSLYGGGGHINISLGYLKKRPLLLRNFIVDLLNHNELFLGVLGFDTNNALSPSLLRPDAWEAIKHELSFVDAYDIDLENVDDFGMQLKRILSESRDPYLLHWHPEWLQRLRYSAFNILHRLDKDSKAAGFGERLELRAVRAQASADVWVRQIRLLDKRIRYLETLTEPIPLKPMLSVTPLLELPSDPVLAEQAVLTPPVDVQEALAAFHQYVTESGEDWAHHQDYLWPQWITDGEVEKFNSNLCDRLLGDAS